MGFSRQKRLSKKQLPLKIQTNNKPKSEVEEQSPQKDLLRIATWNVKRGLIKRELEIKDLLKRENLHVLFLTETDT